MRELSPQRSQALRARRWDAIVLGGALPGLVAAVHLRMAGLRVLVVEEAMAPQIFPGLREPFCIPAGRGEVFDACVAALSLPLVERRLLRRQPIAYQVVLPDARVNVGDPATTTDELVAWGLAKPEAARSALHGIRMASQAEAAAMLSSPWVRAGRTRGRVRREPHVSMHGRGLPADVIRPNPALAKCFDAQVRALSNLATLAPPPEGRARLLGAALGGGFVFPNTAHTVRDLLLRRMEAQGTDRKTLAKRFDLVTWEREAGINAIETGEVWLAQTLILNAPAQRLRRAVRDGREGLPEMLQADAPGRARRVACHWTAPTAMIPEAMANRVILVAGDSVINLSTFRDAEDDSKRHLVASTVVPVPIQEPEVLAALEAAVLDLLPFSENALERQPDPRPQWDDDAELADPPPGEGWPSEADIRVNARPRVYALRRESAAALGFEGDLLLGWRGAEVIRADLSA